MMMSVKSSGAQPAAMREARRELGFSRDVNCGTRVRAAQHPRRGLALGLFYVTVITLADCLTGEAIFLPSFLALAPLLAALRASPRVAERVRDEVFIEPVASSAGPIDVSVSVGGAALQDDG
jgi:hypothetical protein